MGTVDYITVGLQDKDQTIFSFRLIARKGVQWLGFSYRARKRLVVFVCLFVFHDESLLREIGLYVWRRRYSIMLSFLCRSQVCKKTQVRDLELVQCCSGVDP